MNRAFFDSNVLLYTVKQDDPRQLVALAILQPGSIISVQCLNEFASVARRKLGMSWERIAAISNEFARICGAVYPLTIEIHRLGIRLAERYRLSTYDAMIAAVALSADCEMLYSEDMHHGLVIEDRVKIVNPFI